jgi:hypothetical protein
VRRVDTKLVLKQLQQQQEQWAGQLHCSNLRIMKDEACVASAEK